MLSSQIYNLLSQLQIQLLSCEIDIDNIDKAIGMWWKYR